MDENINFNIEEFLSMSILLDLNEAPIVIISEVEFVTLPFYDTTCSSIPRPRSLDRPLMIVSTFFLWQESFSVHKDSAILTILRAILHDTFESGLDIGICEDLCYFYGYSLRYSWSSKSTWRLERSCMLCRRSGSLPFEKEEKSYPKQYDDDRENFFHNSNGAKK